MQSKLFKKIVMVFLAMAFFVFDTQTSTVILIDSVSARSKEISLISEKDCSSFYIFESSFMSYIHNVLIWILTIGGITAVVNLISGVTSCCLMTAYKRVVYYKPNNQNEYIT